MCLYTFTYIKSTPIFFKNYFKQEFYFKNVVSHLNMEILYMVKHFKSFTTSHDTPHKQPTKWLGVLQLQKAKKLLFM